MNAMGQAESAAQSAPPLCTDGMNTARELPQDMMLRMGYCTVHEELTRGMLAFLNPIACDVMA